MRSPELLLLALFTIAVATVAATAIAYRATPKKKTVSSVKQTDVRELVGRLNRVCRGSLESAAGTCHRRSHYSVEVEHWLLNLLAPPDTDLARIVRHFGVDFSRVRSEVAGAVDRLRTGNPGIPVLSDELLSWMYSAWQFISESQDSTSIRTGHLLAALLCEEEFAVRLRDISPELGRIEPNRLWEAWPALVANWTESEAEK